MWRAAKYPHAKKSSMKVSKAKGLCSIFAIGDVKTNEWYLDSGVTSNMARSDQPFVNAIAIDHDVGTTNNSNMKAITKGAIAMETKHGRVDVSDIIPELATNLLSVSTI